MKLLDAALTKDNPLIQNLFTQNFNGAGNFPVNIRITDASENRITDDGDTRITDN